MTQANTNETIQEKFISFTSKIGNSLLCWLKKTGLDLYTKFIKKPSMAIKTCYLLILISILCFGYTWIKHSFTVPLGGDYALQEMTFIFNGYDDWHTFFSTGMFPFWDRSDFLGIDNIGGNSFYYLFDPFLLILLPFPRSWLLQLQGLEFILKMTLAGMFFYWYLGSFKLSDKVRMIGALAFGFSGYSFNYLWFHFIDSVAFLPLVFLGIERIIKDRDPRIFLIGFFLNAMTSYFFFVVFMFGAFFYAIFRFFQTIKERTRDESWGVIGIGIFSFITAIFLGCFTLIPGMYMALSMPRVSSSSYLSNILASTNLEEFFDNLFYYESGQNQNKITPLLNFLFMNDNCYYSNLLNVYWYDNLQSSLYATTPLLLIFFVSLIDSIKQKKYSYLIAIAFVVFLLFTPVGFYLFSGFTVAYARYFIIPISWMIVLDCITIERRREIPRTYLDISAGFVALLDALCCFLIFKCVEENSSSFTSATNWDERTILIPLCLVWLLVCYLVERIFFHKVYFNKAMIIMCGLDIVVMANATIFGQGTTSIMNMSDQIDIESKIVELVKEDENQQDYYRIFNTTVNRGNINLSMREGYSGLGAFHSVYAYGCQDFITRSRIPYTYGNWSMGIHNRRENMETFLGTKYYIVDRIDKDYGAYDFPKEYNSYDRASDYDIPYGYKDVLDLTEEEMDKLGVHFSSETLDYLQSDECNRTLYVNLNFVDFAFAYDTVVDAYWLATSYDSDNEPVYNAYEEVNEYPLLRFAMLEDEDYQKFYKQQKYNAGIVTYVTGKTQTFANTNLENDASSFRSGMLTSGAYTTNSAPIQVYHSNTNIANRLQTTVYSTNWPATANNPSGEYAQCDPDDPTNTACISEYRKTNKFEYINGIRPADTKFDYETQVGDDGQKHSRTVLYNTKLVITPIDKDGNPTVLVPEADIDDPSSGAYISIWDQDNIEWRLFDEDNKLISFAQHSYAEYKQAHGYYTDRPVAKIVGVLKEGTKDDPIPLRRPIIYIIRNADYQSAIDKLKEEPITINSRYETKIDFTTNYSSNKFVVLNYPKQTGWTLKKITYENGERVEKEVTQYKAQGGFIGFEGEIGETNYVLEYETPYFKYAMLLTLLGMFITFGFFVFISLENRNKRILLYADTLKSDTLKDINRFTYAYDNYEKIQYERKVEIRHGDFSNYTYKSAVKKSRKSRSK